MGDKMRHTQKYRKYCTCIIVVIFGCLFFCKNIPAAPTANARNIVPDRQLYKDRLKSLYKTALPYIKFYMKRAKPNGTRFAGLTRSHRLELGNHYNHEEEIIKSAASCYDQSILGRLYLGKGKATIINTYSKFAETKKMLITH